VDAEPPPRTALAAVLDPLAAPLAAGAATIVLFGLFVAAAGKNPLEVYQLMGVGAFGSWFSWQNTLLRASPLLLTALCTALPAQMGLVIIGGEGAFVLGGLAAMAAGLPLADHGAPAIVVQVVMAIAGMAAGGALIALAGALRHWRGVNETISSLLLSSIAIAVMNQVVEGPMRDPASLNKPSTRPLPDADLIGNLPGMDVHWGLAIGLIACVLAWLLMRRTTFGFAARIVGGNPRAARMAGLPVGRMTVIVTALAGAAAASPAWLRSARCRAAPTPTSPPATAWPAFSSLSSRANTRWRSFRSQSCSAASARAAACCSAASICPTPPCWCCKASCSSRCSPARACRRSENGKRGSADDRRQPRPVDRADRGSRRRDPRFDAIPVRQSRRAGDEKSGRINLGLEGTLIMGR